MPTPVSRRYAVVKAVADRIKTVTLVNGYNHDLSASTFVGRRIFGDTDPLPAVTVLEVPDIQIPDSRPESGTAQKGSWEFFVQGSIKATDPMDPTKDAYLLMADVTKVLSAILDPNNDPMHGSTPNPIYMLGGRLTSFDIGGFHVRQNEEAPGQSNFYLRIRTQVVEKLTSPYDS